MKVTIIKSTAYKMLTNWDYSAFGEINKGGMTIDFLALVVKFVIGIIHILLLVTLPVSVFLVIKISRWSEISNLRSWVKTMRRDRGFFRNHYYIEIKRHIKEHESAYHLTLNWN